MVKLTPIRLSLYLVQNCERKSASFASFSTKNPVRPVSRLATLKAQKVKNQVYALALTILEA